MTTSALALETACQHYRDGDLAAAEVGCRQVLAAEPGRVDALHLLGLVLQARGRLDESIALYRQVVRLCPDNVALHQTLAVAHAARGQYREAAACYREALRLRPDDPDVLNDLGFVLACVGDWTGAVAGYRRCLELNPRHAVAWCNLGIAHVQRHELGEAVRCFREAVLQRPHYGEALGNLANALLLQGNPAEAADCYRRVLLLRPDDARAAYNLAGVYLGQGQWANAAACLRQSLAADPTNVGAYRHLGKLCFYRLNDLAGALACYRQVLALAPDDAEARFLVAALSGESAPARPPPEFVAALYDERGAHFDRDPVERLGYCSPALLQAALAPPPSPRSLTVLDLGCGTGLCGAQFRDWAERLVGVDLSRGMLEQARAKRVYDELILGDVLEPLRAGAGQYDLVLASDVVLYLGDLQPLFDAVRGALRGGGRFAFTVDLLDGADYRLLPFGHYAHARSYLQRVAAAAGLHELSAGAAVFPRDGGPDAAGLVVVLRSSH